MRHYLSATRVEWNSRFEKFPTNKLLSGFEGNLEENLEVCKSMMESYA